MSSVREREIKGGELSERCREGLQPLPGGPDRGGGERKWVSGRRPTG